MSRRTVLVVMVAVAVLASGMAVGPVFGEDEGKNVHWEVAGTFAYVNFQVPGVDGQTFSLVFQDHPGYLVNSFVKGTFGHAHLMVVGWSDPALQINPAACGPFPQVVSIRNDAVFTFDNQEMLFATLDPGMVSYSCLGPLPAVMHMDITGGTGKFQGASGHFDGTFIAVPVGPPTSGAFYAETGTIEGWIER